MRFPRGALVASLLLGLALTLGCNDESKGMRNMIPGTGPGQQKEMPLKKGKKPQPYEPPSPKAPP